MARKMESIKIETTKNGMISISQDDLYSDTDIIIIISPDQVDILCQWLKEERDKLKEKE